MANIPTQVRKSLERHGLSDEQLKTIFRTMLLQRQLDNRGFQLNRQGKVPFALGSEGHEALQAGAAMAFVRGKDILAPYYRDLGLSIGIGLTPYEIMLSIFARAADHSGGRQFPHHYASKRLGRFTISSIIAAQTSHAVGAAYAIKLRGETGRAVLTTFGDGATSEGDFHVGMNFAAVYTAPVIMFVQNNQYAISMRTDQQTHTKTIAEKAMAYGMDGYLVDGNDILAVYLVTKHCADKARSGKGPSLIEAYTYRYGPHSSADDDTRYRPKGELEMWRTQRDPVTRMRKFLELRGLWSEEQEQKLQAEVKAQLAQAMEEAEKSPLPEPLSVLDYAYAERTPHLEWERQELAAELGA